MRLDVQIGGRSRSVTIEPAGKGRYRVSLDGTVHLVDAVRIGEYGLSVIVDGERRISRELQVAPGPAPGELLVGVGGLTAVVAVDGRRSRRQAPDGAARGAGEQPILAPMPGRVVRLLVGPGDEVAVRQPVVVVEAMKMENELRAPKAGRVKDVAVTSGMSVEAGRVLVVIE